MKTNLSQSEIQAHPVYPYPFNAPTRRALNQPKTMLIIAFCMALQTTAFVVILPLFALRFSHFGAGAGSLGTSVMASAMAGALAAPLLGALADRFGRRPLVVSALAIYVLSFRWFSHRGLAPGAHPLASGSQRFVGQHDTRGTRCRGGYRASRTAGTVDRFYQWGGLGRLDRGANFGRVTL